MVRNIENVKLPQTNEAYNKLMAFLFSFPNGEWSLSVIANKISISKITANRVVNKLLQEGIINKKVYGRTWVITVNKENNNYKNKKIVFNLDMVLSSDILDLIPRFIHNYQAIVLFGSYLKGEDNENSSIDIAVKIPGNSNLKIENMGIIPKFGLRENIAVNVYTFSLKNTNNEVFINIANGMVLKGFLETGK